MAVNMTQKSTGKTASVHPDEVANYADGGWRVEGETVSLDDATTGQLVDELQHRLAVEAETDSTGIPVEAETGFRGPRTAIPLGVKHLLGLGHTI
ncbi:hypothetical protein [Sphingosinicella sp.]|uniref:hypothetical protein n=1 Tax=Sphingosinicella sp. TaxID=1917971 RepID=UPI00182DA64A|nr:hypothetical protein [Sphingosinicella sp.]MBA4758860.1 hypothetical protein [Sphingosinicella sp.]